MTERLCKISEKGNVKIKQTKEMDHDDQRDKIRYTQQCHLLNTSNLLIVH